MCGIIGEISHKNIKSTEWISKAGIVTHHRGPDYFGKWISQEKKVAFGHNRLSIIDLSSDGNQPMFSTCSNYVIIFNGELYNYKNLKKELIEKGLSFNSRTDTEVLLNSYKYWGENCLQKLEGMFAFAIYDKKKNIILLARDKSGEKPLYFYCNSDSLSFCSELKGLLENPKIDKILSRRSLAQFLYQGYVSGNNCLIKNIKKLKPGEYLKYNLSNGDILKKKYFFIPTQEKIVNNYPEESILNTLINLFEKSIKKQLNADVPVGVLLSGGIDSSLITAFASQNKNKLNTFTFLNNMNKDDFELKNSRVISEFFSTNHNEIFYSDVNASIMSEISNFIDEPIFDSSIIPTYLISKEIKKYCTVALGGDGGDELFGGYDHYPRILKLEKIGKIMPTFLKKNISEFSNRILPLGFRGRNWLNILSKNFKDDYLDFAVYFDERNCGKIIDKRKLNFNKSKLDRNLDGVKSDDIIYKACIQDFNNFLPEDILAKNDRFSMANSVELRSPFLNTEIINFVFGKLHSKYKVNSGEKKIILRKIATKVLPKHFIFNKKRGFSIPINDYFKQEKWKTFAKEILLDQDSLFNSAYTEKILKKQFFNHNNSERLFGLIVFELWKKKNKVTIE